MVVVVIIWWLDLQLHVQSVPITTKVVSSNPAQEWCTRDNIMFSPGTPVSSINRTDRHHITEILLKVALNNITLAL
jgi:hypothetical protein